MDQTILQNLGLSDKEAQIYTLLMELGKVQAAELISKSGLKRPTVYKVLETLTAKALVKSEDIKKKLHFSPLPPENLIHLSERQYEQHQRTRDDLRALLPHLAQQYILSVEQPVITTFEGVEGLKQIYLDTIKVNKPIYAALQASEVDQKVMKWLEEEYIHLRVKQKIHADVIISSGDWSKEYIERRKEQFTETRHVSNILFPFAHEINIYGDKVAFINFKKGDALIGIVIHHPLIRQTMKALFDLAWKGAERSS